MSGYMDPATDPLEGVIRALPLPALVLAPDGAIRAANPPARSRLGLSGAPKAWPALAELVPGAGGEALERWLADCPADGHPVSREVVLSLVGEASFPEVIHLARLDGGMRFLCTLDPLPGDGKGDAAAQPWRFALQGAGDGVWDWDLRTGRVRYCPRLRRILGYAEGDPFEESLDQWLHLLHPEDLPRVSSALQRHVQGGSERYTSEYRVRHRSGGWIWVLGRGRVIQRDADGRPLRVAGTLSDISERKHQEDELRRMASTDFLTGLANRRQFLGRMADELARVKRRPDHPAVVLMMDLDHFKSINDTYGHSTGDAVIRHVAELLRTVLRRMDLGARMGGEEFAALLPATALEDARGVAERLRRTIKSTPVVYRGGIVGVTVSIGLATLDPRDEDSDATLRRADLALYRAKGEGRNLVAVAGPPGTEDLESSPC
ncbi:PAS domain S-box-containing protein/diguanylate cyclase (GGDEF) domain-containing protein [Ectothiorhodospira mobilis]|uniref:PAS domain S-box-containing protein/diguanylate cyclase (GGDEF) domain-containing protein n=2 Tax=Ectothiorhodospira mobilis TaxID=195064 RepID=A0A1I4PC06_ECTMO|nr:PAS domain S-box-containing protein/diguanylate cyclase (GGDEF) domain-containing protein [Ectothiorhodospira mobilis]